MSSKKFIIKDQKKSNQSKKFLIESKENAVSTEILENLVRKVESTQVNIDEDNEQLIQFDEKTEKFKVSTGGSFSYLIKSIGGRNYSYYVVNYDENERIENLNCELRDSKSGTKINLKTSFDLSLIRSKGTKALKFFKNKRDLPQVILEKKINKWIHNFIAQHPNFNTDFFLIEKDLRKYLKKQLEQKGIHIKYIYLDPSYINDPAHFPPQHLTIIHKTSCEILDDRIEVKNKIVLNLFDKQAFLWKNIDNPEVWIKDKINAIIQNKLINKSFKEIIDEFEEGLKEQIVSDIGNAIKEIGYSVKHIISVPSEEIAAFLSGFILNLEEFDTYETSDPEIKVRLSVIIEGKGTSISGIDRKYIKAGKSIIDEVEKQTIETISTTLRGTTPKNYYTDFDGVSNNIKQEVKNILRQKFSLDENDFKIFISFLKTDLKERFDMLFAERGHLIVENKSADIQYKIKYRVQAVNDWHIFHKNHIKYHQKTIEEYKDISSYLKNEIELTVKDLSNTIINRNLENIIVKLFERAQYIIKEEFGLYLGTPRLERLSKNTYNESSFYVNTFLEKKKKIEERLRYAILEDNNEAIEDLEEKLGKVNTDLKNLTTSISESLRLNASSTQDDELHNGDASTDIDAISP